MLQKKDFTALDLSLYDINCLNKQGLNGYFAILDLIDSKLLFTQEQIYFMVRSIDYTKISPKNTLHFIGAYYNILMQPTDNFLNHNNYSYILNQFFCEDKHEPLKFANLLNDIDISLINIFWPDIEDKYWVIDYIQKNNKNGCYDSIIALPNISRYIEKLSLDSIIHKKTNKWKLSKL